MDNMNFKNRIQYFGDNLSISEKLIADYIITNPKDAVTSTITNLAKNIGTSNSTITRFCQKLHYRNYNEFQTLLSNEITPTKLPSEISSKIKFYHMRLLTSSMELLNSNELIDFVNQILKSHQILLCGIGSSGLTAHEFSIRLVQMGLQSRAITDSSLMLTQSSMFTSKDLIIAISNSGETSEVVKACEIAKKAGTPIYALTQKKQSSLAGVADKIMFISGINQLNDSKYVNSQLAFIFLIDIITYILLEDSTLNDNYQKTARAISIQWEL